ncbi:unnamed protein product [Pleuronectes platessa]|uniref:Uncharacterized protein n=1 Tax=Pleuronectes platessa TaxID=8262 RepID=A0A9N7Z1H7_PLEPL|nr:unnamed protein product [Pleuronectes platessa]
MKGTREGEAGSIRFPLSISKIGLSLPGRCLFVSPRRGLKRERMQAARVERQEQAEGESTRQIEDGGGGEPSLGWDHLRRPLCWEIMWADKAVLEGGQGHRGSPASRE